MANGQPVAPEVAAAEQRAPVEGQEGQEAQGGGDAAENIRQLIGNVDKSMDLMAEVFTAMGVPEQVMQGLADVKSGFQQVVTGAVQSVEGGGQAPGRGPKPKAMQDPGGGSPESPAL